MKKQLLIIAALCAVVPAFAAPSAFNPRYLLPAITGVQGEHLKLHNLLQNMAPQAAALIEKKAVEAHRKGPSAVSIGDKYAQTSNHIKTEMLWKYLLSYATPIGRRAPQKFHRTRMQQAASLLKFVCPAIYNQVGNTLGTRAFVSSRHTYHPNNISFFLIAAISALTSIPETFSRKALAERLAHKNILVSSWSVPAHMRGKQYLMFHGPCGYALKQLPSLLLIVREIAQALNQARIEQTYSAKTINKTSALVQNSLVTMLPLLSLTTKYYMLESDYQKLSNEDQIAVYQAVYEDVTSFSDNLVYKLAPAFKQANYDAAKAWAAEAKAQPMEKLFTEPKDAVVARARALPGHAHMKFNDMVAYLQELKPASKASA